LFELDTWLFTAAGRGWMPEDQQAAMEDEIEQLSAMILRMATTLRAKDTLPSRAN
jgi:hypothetical protein